MCSLAVYPGLVLANLTQSHRESSLPYAVAWITYPCNNVFPCSSRTFLVVRLGRREEHTSDFCTLFFAGQSNIPLSITHIPVLLIIFLRFKQILMNFAPDLTTQPFHTNNSPTRHYKPHFAFQSISDYFTDETLFHQSLIFMRWCLVFLFFCLFVSSPGWLTTQPQLKITSFESKCRCNSLVTAPRREDFLSLLGTPVVLMSGYKILRNAILFQMKRLF